MKRQRGIATLAIVALVGVAVAAAGHFWQVSSLKSDITDLTKENATLSKAVSELQAANTACETKVKETNEKIDGLKKAQEVKSALAEEEIKRAKAETQKFKSRADKLQRSPPSQPGKPCESLKDKFDDYLKDRRTRAS